MTPPMTPREKVELKPCPFCGGDAVAGSNFDNDHYVMCGADCDKCGGMVGYMKTEMAAIENWNRRTALASGSGDHAELARLARIWSDTSVTNHKMPGDTAVIWSRRLDALLAENAALRGERDDLKFSNAQMTGALEAARDDLVIAREDDLRHLQQATEAERKLAEAVGAIKGVIEWDKRRGFPIPYKVRDPLHAFLSSKEAECG